jgi:hypothetical protein
MKNGTEKLGDRMKRFTLILRDEETRNEEIVTFGDNEEELSVDLIRNLSKTFPLYTMRDKRGA